MAGDQCAGRLLSGIWARLAWLCRISLGAGNGAWSGVGQGEKNVLHREDRTSKQIHSQRV